MSRELETVALWRDGGGGLWMGRSGPERPWNWLTGTDASPDDLLPGGSRKVEEPFGSVFCQVGVGRFGVSFSPCERRVSGRFGVGRSCWLLVIALVIA